MFNDRTDAGIKLAHALEKYKDQNVLVLAIPRGGVEVGYQVARYLNADFSIIISRKLPFPDNTESGFGAVAEDGSFYINPRTSRWVQEQKIELIREAQIEEIRRRIAVLRKGKKLPEIEGRTVILVDDGIAMGSTMRASIMLCRNRKAAKVIVAVPVTGEEVAREIGKLADEIIVLEMPWHFYAVAQVYRYWYDVPDSEVIEIMEKFKR